MSKFKRALSVFLAFAMVFGTFSCLGAVVAPKASAAEGTSSIKTYAELAADYDDFIYLGSEVYEITTSDGTLSGTITSSELTDYYVDAGQLLEFKMYIKSDMYAGNPALYQVFDNDFFDVHQATPTAVADGSYTAGVAVTPNAEHPVVSGHGLTVTITSKNANWGWIKNTTGIDTTTLSAWDYVQTDTLNKDTIPEAYSFTSDLWVYPFYAKVLDTVAEGDTGTTELDARFFKSGPVPAETTDAKSGRKGNFPLLSAANASGADTQLTDLLSILDAVTSGDLKYLLLDDAKHVFTCGKNPADASNEPIAGTSSIKTYAELAADYDDFIYLGSEVYEITTSDGTLSGTITDSILTDYYVDAGQLLEFKMYIKSDMYAGNPALYQVFDNDFFDVHQATPTAVADGSYTAGVAVTPNAEHPVVSGHGLTVTITSKNANWGWIKNTTGIDTTTLSAWDYVQTDTLNKDTIPEAYSFTSDLWVYPFYAKVLDTVAEGDTGTTELDARFFKSGPVPAETANAKSGRKGNVPLLSAANASGADTQLTDLLSILDAVTSGDLKYLLLDDAKHVFTCGKNPAQGGGTVTYTATFTVDGETYGDVVTGATGTEIAAPATNPSKDGYVFKGWALDGTTEILEFPQTMGSANVVYDAIFEQEVTYTATFYVDGAVYGDVLSYAQGATIVAPADPSKTGYTFAGWSPAVGTMGAANAEFTATWTANTYTVSFFKELTDTSAYTTNSVSYNGTYTVPTAPSKTGYNFAGWVDADGAAMPSTHTVDSNVSYYASWTAGTYNATFKADGGEFADGTDTVVVPTVFGEAIVAPDAPTKTGYTFAGWTPAVGDMTAEGMTFTATWEAQKIGVYFYDGTELIDKTEGDYGSSIAAIANPSKEGYDFKGWVDADGNAVSFPINLGTEAVSVYAKWEGKPYYIEFYAPTESDWLSGGDQICGDTIEAPTAPSKTGYTFIGWFDADGNAMPETVPAIANQVYYGKYEAIIYVATFDAAGGQFADGNATATYEGIYGSTIVLPANPAKEGYTFNAWDPKVTSTTKMPAKDVTYTATWNINSYKVNYYVDGVLKHTDTYEFGADVTAWTYTPAEGETFGGWSTSIPATMPANDVDIYGTTGTAVYTATFLIDGDADYKVELPFAYGAAVVAPEYTAAEGYTFSGWTVDATMPAHDVTYTATLTANTYNAIFYLDEAGTVYKTVPTVYGQEIEFPEDPTMDGKIFSEWDNTATVMGAGDMEFVALWEDIEYIIDFLDADGNILEDYALILYWGDTIYAEDVPTVTKEGWEFKNWTINGEAVTFPLTIDSAIASNDNDYIEIVPEFGIVGFDITYYVDGDVYNSTTYEYGADIAILDTLAKEGYTFSGWKDADGNDATLPATMPAHDIEIYGTWTVNQYKAVFNAGEGEFADGTTVKEIMVNYGETPECEIPVLAGYGFAGWTPALAPMGINGATYTATFAAGMVTYTVETYTMDTTGAYGAPVVETLNAATDADVTADAPAKTGFTLDTDASVLTGKVAADGSTTLKVYYIRNQYTLAVTVDGATETETYYYEEAVAEIADPVKTGYTFKNWTVAIPATMPANDIATEAVFEINEYTITFVDTGDIAYSAITQNYATKIGEVADPVKTGYTFAGWIDQNGDAAVVPAAMPAYDLTLTAQWTINQYTITFVDTGDVAYEAITQDYATDIADIADPVKTGYTFKGWDVAIPDTMPASDMTITAKWEVNYYDATFNLAGGMIDKDAGPVVVPTAYGSVPAIADPVRVGYYFAGWSPELVAMGIDGATYTAQWIACSYNVIFDANGGAWADGATSKTVETVFDEAIEVPTEDPTKEGYLFKGWSLDGTTVIEITTLKFEGVVYYAVWENDLNFCRVQSVTRTTENVTDAMRAAYDIKVMESPVKLQIVYADDESFSWTYDRNDTRIADDLTDSGLVAIKAYNAADEEVALDSEDTAYEIWTVVTVLTEADYKVRAKVTHASTSWESLEFAYKYTMKYDEVTDDPDMIISVAVDKAKVKRGTVNPVTIVTDESVQRLRITMELEDGTSRIVSYSTSSSVVTYTKNGDGTATWVLNIKFTYSATADEQVQDWTVWYRAAGESGWTETDKHFVVTVTRYAPVEETTESTYDPYTVISVSAASTVEVATYTEITIVTTADATRIRLNNQAGKTTTYLASSNNVISCETSADGTTKTWTIKYRFGETGSQTWAAQCRGNAWSEIKDNTCFTIDVTEKA